MKKPRIQLANNFSYEQVALANSLFTKLSMGQDVRGLLRTTEYARLRQKFQAMGDKRDMGASNPEVFRQQYQGEWVTEEGEN